MKVVNKDILPIWMARAPLSFQANHNSNSLGRFTYHSVTTNYYKFGVTSQGSGLSAFVIATPTSNNLLLHRYARKLYIHDPSQKLKRRWSDSREVAAKADNGGQLPLTRSLLVSSLLRFKAAATTTSWRQLLTFCDEPSRQFRNVDRWIK